MGVTGFVIARGGIATTNRNGNAVYLVASALLLIDPTSPEETDAIVRQLTEEAPDRTPPTDADG